MSAPAAQASQAPLAPHRMRMLIAAIVIGAVGLLELAIRIDWVSRHTIVPPSEMAVRLIELLGTGRAWASIAETGINVGAAVLIAIIGGWAAGIALHALPRVRRAVNPILTGYYAVPIFVFYPILIVILGVGRAPLIIIGASFALIAMAVASLNALDRVPAVYLKAGRVARLGRWGLLWRVRLPAMAPYMVAGLKLAITYSMIGVIGGEFILSGDGIGHQVAFAYDNFDNDTMYAFMLLIVLVGIALTVALNRLERRLKARVVK